MLHHQDVALVCPLVPAADEGADGQGGAQAFVVVRMCGPGLRNGSRCARVWINAPLLDVEVGGGLVEHVYVRLLDRHDADREAL